MKAHHSTADFDKIIFDKIIKRAWVKFNKHKKIARIENISSHVSTNLVFKIFFEKQGYIIAKLSYFGQFEFFLRDHEIINSLSNNLLFPYDLLLARALVKKDKLFSYRYREGEIDMWVIFYNPVRIKSYAPKILPPTMIKTLAKDLALFHDSCLDIVDELPHSSKTMKSDILDFMEKIRLNNVYDKEKSNILLKHCELFLENSIKYQAHTFNRLPVFVDWNIGNFSINRHGLFYSRWDYDWFRMSPRTMDFYFWARVVRTEGDQATFSYTIAPLQEERFLAFLKNYHTTSPLSKNEVFYLKECYRFFILQYVINLGDLFFLPKIRDYLFKETFSNYLVNIDDFDGEKIIRTLSL